MSIGVVLFVFLSISIGIRIGTNRDWIAGIFLYVIPVITFTSLVTIVTLRSKAGKKVE
jgi:hypothetical protein